MSCSPLQFHADTASDACKMRSLLMSEPRTKVGGLQVATVLYNFVEKEALPGTGLDAAAFWDSFAALLKEFSPRNAALMAKRDALQAKLDAWHRDRKGKPHDASAYQTFLKEIGYLLPEPGNFLVDTDHVDDEIATIAGPQLVVPVNNARYALNAANARWGSLYDALYGTDAIPEDGAGRSGRYDPQRGAKVIAFARDFLDQHFA